MQPAVHQSGYSLHSLGMHLTMMAVHLSDRLVGAHVAQGVLGHYATLREGSVVRYVLRGACFVLPSWPVLVGPTRLAARGCSQLLRVQLTYAYKRQVSFGSHTIGKPLHQLRTLEQFHVTRRSSHTLRDVTDPSRMHVHSHLALDSVLLFLARIPTVRLLLLFFALLWGTSVTGLRRAHLLLEGVNHNGKLRQLGEQLAHRASMFASRIRHFHSVFTCFRQDGQGASEQARHSRMGYSKQETEHLISGVLPQPHHRNEYLLSHRQGERVSSSYAALTLMEWSVEQQPLLLRSHKHWCYIMHKLLELCWFQPGESTQHIGVCF